MKMGNPQTQREIFAQIDVSTIPRRNWFLEQLATGSVSFRHVVMAVVFLGLMLVLVSSLGGRKGFSISTSVQLSYHYLPSDRRQIVILRSIPIDWPQQESLMRRFANIAGAVIVLDRVSRDVLRNLDRNIALSHPPDVMWVFIDAEGGDFVGVTNQVICGANSVLVSKSYHLTILTFAGSDLARIPETVFDILKSQNNRRLLVTGAAINSANGFPQKLRNYCPIVAGVSGNLIATMQAFKCDNSNLMFDTSDSGTECILDMRDNNNLRCMKSPQEQTKPGESTNPRSASKKSRPPVSEMEG